MYYRQKGEWLEVFYSPRLEGQSRVYAINVLLESATLRRTVPASRDLTGVGVLPCVSAHMRLEIATLCRTVSAPRDLTGVRALTGVGPHMLLESATLCRPVATPRDLTGVGALPRVR